MTERPAATQRLALLLAMAMFVLVVDTSLMNVSISAVVKGLDTTVWDPRLAGGRGRRWARRRSARWPTGCGAASEGKPALLDAGRFESPHSGSGSRSR